MADRTRSCVGALLVLAAALGVGSPAAQAVEESPAELLAALDRASLSPAGAVPVSRLVLAIDIADLRLEEGWLIPATTLAGRVTEVVFVGTGRIRLEPPDATEAAQLEIYTGESRLDRPFDAAVLVVANDNVSATLFKRPLGTPDAATLRRATELWARWRESAERRGLGVDGMLLADSLGEAVYANGFLGWLHRGEELPFVLLVDPTAEEPLTVGRFEPLEADERERRRILRALRNEQKGGRGLGLELADLGQWEQWILAPLGTRSGKPWPRQTLFEPARYVLDARISGRGELQLEATARLVLRALAQGHRVVTASLHPDLAVRSVRDARGNDLAHHRAGARLAIVLPAAPAPGDDTALEIRYDGRFFDKEGRSLYALRDSLGWYPRVGAIDRAPYEVTLSWPQRLEVIAAGERVDGGVGADGNPWERRRLARPSFGTSFEIGRFEIERVSVPRPGTTPVAVEVCFDVESEDLPKSVRKEIVDAVADSLAYYGELFQPYPEAGLRVVTVPRWSSQGLPGFVTLSSFAISDLDGFFRALFGMDDRRTTVAHEIAHQWWGNRVGWKSYRDQWISEAMASYSALLWARNRLPVDKKPAIGPTSGWKSDLLATTEDGRTLESLGPVTLGVRLLGKSSTAYDAIVYKKGAVVLDMLSRQWQEKAFQTLLGHLVLAASDKVLSTEVFFSILERLSGSPLDGFANRFVYGTGLPEVHYDYEIGSKQGEKWPVKVTARQLARYRFQYRLARTDDGRLDVLRERAEQASVDDTTFVVPFQIPVDEPWPASAGEPPKPKRGDPPLRPQVEGRMALRGVETSVELKLDYRPVGLILDGRDEVFATFFNSGRSPKRALLRQAQDAASAGDRERARARFREVLAATVRVPVEYARADDPDEMAREGHGLDALAHLGLARLALEQGDLIAARRGLDDSKRELDGRQKIAFEGDRALLESRLALASGDARGAFRQLRRAVLTRESVDDTEAWLLLAVAARATGEKEELERAIEVAKRRNVDVSLLAAD